MTAIFAAAALLCAGGWLVERISLLALVWYIQGKKMPLPSREEMREGTRWAWKEIAVNRWKRFCKWMQYGHPPLWAWCITWTIAGVAIVLSLAVLIMRLLQ